MELILLLIGIVFILCGMLLSRQTSLINKQHRGTEQEIGEYYQAIEKSHVEFRQQFEMTQSELENLYAPDFFRILDKLERIENKLDSTLNHHQEISHEVEHISEINSPKPIVEIDEFLQKRIDMYEQLVAQEKTVEDMAKLLNVGKGEILLLRNLSEKLAQK